MGKYIYPELKLNVKSSSILRFTTIGNVGTLQLDRWPRKISKIKEKSLNFVSIFPGEAHTDSLIKIIFSVAEIIFSSPNKFFNIKNLFYAEI